VGDDQAAIRAECGAASVERGDTGVSGFVDSPVAAGGHRQQVRVI